MTSKMIIQSYHDQSFLIVYFFFRPFRLFFFPKNFEILYLFFKLQKCICFKTCFETHILQKFQIRFI